MGTYAAASDLQARLPYRTIDANSSPNTTQVNQWITEAESYLTATLKAVQVTTPVTDSDGVEIMKSWATDYVEGRYRQALAAAGGDGANDDGEILIERFDKVLSSIMNDPALYGAMLGGGSSGDNTRRMRGYWKDNADSKTISGGDFDPVITRAEEF